MANILIVGAMTEEVEQIQVWLQGEPAQVKRAVALPYWVGHHGEHALYLVQSGIGKVAGAISVSALLDLFSIDYILNAGSAGGLKDGQAIGDVVLASKVAYHDVDVRAFGYTWGQVPQMPATYLGDSILLKKAQQSAQEMGLPFHSGLIVSGDTFVNKAEQVEMIKEYFPEAIAVEMEAGAIAQVAHLYGIPYLIIRALSDKADSDSPSDFPAFLEKASHSSSQLIQKIVDSL